MGLCVTEIRTAQMVQTRPTVTTPVLKASGLVKRKCWPGGHIGGMLPLTILKMLCTCTGPTQCMFEVLVSRSFDFSYFEISRNRTAVVILAYPYFPKFCPTRYLI